MKDGDGLDYGGRSKGGEKQLDLRHVQKVLRQHLLIDLKGNGEKGKRSRLTLRFAVLGPNRRRTLEEQVLRWKPRVSFGTC